MSASSVEILAQLRGLFRYETLTNLKKAASYYKNDRASLAVMVQGCLDSGRLPQLPDRVDIELENFLRLQLHFLEDVLPDADPAYIEEMFNKHAGTAGMETAVLEATSSPDGYPKKTVPMEEDQGMFDVQLYCELVPDPLGSFSHENYIMTDRMMTEAVEYLLKIFGEDKRAEITSVVKESQSLYLSYKKMREVGDEAYAQFFTNVKTVQPKTFDLSPDYGQVFEKLFIENEGVILSFLTKKRREQQLPVRECSVCCLLSTKIIKVCSDCHEMCGPCVKQYTEMLYHEGVLFFPCAFEKCTLLLSNAVIRSVWDTSRYSKLLEDRGLIPVIDDRLMACPFCNFRNENSDSREICCTHCSKNFCATCKKIGHFPLECNKKENDLCKLVEESMTGELVRKCPKCQTPFIKKREYCNKICCPKCKTYMCYICRKALKNDTQKHFYGQGIMPSEAPGCCPLFSDINALHVTSIIQAGTQMLQKIQSENPDVELEYDPLAVLPKKEKSDGVPNQF